MPADIRSFFTPKGGSSAPSSAKPATKKSDEPKARRSNRRIIDDSEEEDVAKSTSQPPAKKQKKKDGVVAQGVAISADDFFSDKATPTTATPKSSKTSTSKPAAEASTKSSSARPSSRSNTTSSHKEPVLQSSTKTASKTGKTLHYNTARQDHEDVAMEDADEAADDIFAADFKAGNKSRQDDYLEENDDVDVVRPTRLATRAKRIVDDDDDYDENDNKKSPAAKQAQSTSKKRKAPVDSDDADDVNVATPKKKPAVRKATAPSAKKKTVAGAPENPEYQSILDSIPTVRPPTPDPQDSKFDFRKHAMGGANAALEPPNPIAELPSGEDGCLTGLTFVFTGQLQTIGREEAQALVKQYGGKVTGQPSSKTSYVVLGEGAGPSKIAKIKANGIKTINEEGLFELIRKLPAHGGSGKAAEKAREKQKAEEAKVKQQALEMEKEERARRSQTEKEARQADAARGLAPGSTTSLSTSLSTAQLWTTKYAPTQLSQICGNKKNVELIQEWLRDWEKSRKYEFKRPGGNGMGGYRAVLISGPPGIGKTTAAHLAAKLAGYDVIESNASDTRSKKLVESGVTDVINNTSLLGYFAGDGKKVNTAHKKLVLIMDEVDGMSAGDRGGVGALARLCKKTEVPMILICNDRRLQKMKPFDFVTRDIKFSRPTVDQIRSRIMTICHREGLKLPPNVIDSLIEGSGKDIRQIINMLSTIKLDHRLAEDMAASGGMSFDKSKEMAKAWEKHTTLLPWDITQKLLGGSMFGPASKATLNDKIELYFNDYEFTPLMIQENYLKARPAMLMGAHGFTHREAQLKALEQVDKAAASISDGDLVDRLIRGPQQQWSLMPTHAVFSTVRPSAAVAGTMGGACSFTAWLGHNSKQNRLGRCLREIHAHMRLRSSADHNELRMQYLPLLWARTVRHLADGGKDAVPEVIQLMDEYYLQRDDFDALSELVLEPELKIETQTKASFTRIYNSMSHPLPFMKASSVIAPARKAREVPDLEEAIDLDEEPEDDPAAAATTGDQVLAAEDEDIKLDKYIKQPKKKATTGGKSAGAGPTKATAKKKTTATTATAKTTTTASKKPAAKKAKTVPAKSTTKARTTAAGRKKKNVDYDDEDDDEALDVDDDDEMEDFIVEDDDDDEDDDDALAGKEGDDDEDFKPRKRKSAPPASKAKGRAKAKATSSK